jgi:hypothetical protein
VMGLFIDRRIRARTRVSVRQIHTCGVV